MYRLPCVVNHENGSIIFFIRLKAGVHECISHYSSHWGGVHCVCLNSEFHCVGRGVAQISSHRVIKCTLVERGELLMHAYCLEITCSPLLTI